MLAAFQMPSARVAAIVVASMVMCCGPFVAAQQKASLSQDQFPYRAEVQNAGAEVRSGPGSVHYATDRLPLAAEVEVYRHDPGGWMAIRPPQRSFSLIQANEVELLGNGIAKVIADHSRAWVGTRLNPVDQPMWQVQLKQGEILEVIGKVDREKYQVADDQPDWIQIAPPAGEFRWIASKDIKLSRNDSPTISQSQVVDKNHTPDGQSNFSLDSDELLAPQHDAGDAATNPDDSAKDWSLDVEQQPEEYSTSSGWKPAKRSIKQFVSDRSQYSASTEFGSMSSQISGMGYQVKGQLSNVRSAIFDQGTTAAPQPQPASTQLNIRPLTGNGPTGAAPLSGSTNALPSGSSLGQLELQLTRQLLKQPQQWQLQQLAATAIQIKQQAINPAEVSAADRILTKIRKCREIQAGYLAVDGNEPRYANASFDPANVSSQSVGEVNSNFDANGWLNELAVNGGMSPSQYVLQDDQGNVTHHISVPPGLNMKRYLRKRVGIIGLRGFHKQLNLNHVAAERIVVLDNVFR